VAPSPIDGGQISSGASGSGSRTGASGFSGGEGGSLMGGGMGSAGMRRWRGGSRGVTKFVSRGMAFRCRSWARGSESPPPSRKERENDGAPSVVMASTGLKLTSRCGALRGAEAPLFHGGAGAHLAMVAQVVGAHRDLWNSVVTTRQGGGNPTLSQKTREGWGTLGGDGVNRAKAHVALWSFTRR